MPSRKVVVTDYTFPGLAAEAKAAADANAVVVAHQCRTAEEVAEAVRDADVAVVQFAPLTAQAVAGMRPGAAIIRYGIGYDNVDVVAASRSAMPRTIASMRSVARRLAAAAGRRSGAHAARGVVFDGGDRPAAKSRSGRHSRPSAGRPLRRPVPESAG